MFLHSNLNKENNEQFKIGHVHLHAFLRAVFRIKLMLEFVLSEIHCNQYFHITYIGCKQIEKLGKSSSIFHEDKTIQNIIYTHVR